MDSVIVWSILIEKKSSGLDRQDMMQLACSELGLNRSSLLVVEVTMRLLISLLLLLQLPAGPVSDGALRDSLTARYAKKLVTVRGFPTGTKLQFDTEGALIGGTPGVFTLDGNLRVESVDVSPDRVEFRGRQAFLEYNERTRRLEEAVRGSRMTLEFARKAGTPVERGIEAVLVPFEGLSKLVPAYWTKFLSGDGELDAVVDPVTGVPVPRASEAQGLVPRATKQTTPVYPPAVQPFAVAGTVVLRVTVDEQGKPRVSDIVTPIGFGLDQAAIDAVNQWEFEPARKDGKGVKVYFRVRVNFNPPR
jgi:TonB family protein